MTIHPILKSDSARRSKLKAGKRIEKAIAKAEKAKKTQKVRGEISKSKATMIIERDGRICRWCMKPCTPKDPPVVGHIVPVAQGGNSCESNLACLHASCNSGLGARTSAAIRTLLRNTGHSIKPETKEN